MSDGIVRRLHRARGRHGGRGHGSRRPDRQTRHARQHTLRRYERGRRIQAPRAVQRHISSLATTRAAAAAVALICPGRSAVCVVAGRQRDRTMRRLSGTAARSARGVEEGLLARVHVRWLGQRHVAVILHRHRRGASDRRHGAGHRGEGSMLVMQEPAPVAVRAASFGPKRLAASGFVLGVSRGGTKVGLAVGELTLIAIPAGAIRRKSPAQFSLVQRALLFGGHGKGNNVTLSGRWGERKE